MKPSDIAAVVRGELTNIRDAVFADVAEMLQADGVILDPEQRRLDACRRQSLPAPHSADENAFKGAFIKSVDDLRKFIRAAHSPENATRALDSSAFVTGGRLGVDTADRFIDHLIEQQPTLSRVQIRKMNGPEAAIDVLEFAERRMRKAVEGTDPTPVDAISTSRRTLNSVEVILPQDVTLSWLEANVESRGIEQKLAVKLATQFGNDMADLGWNGDESETGDDFRSINDGWLVLMLADPTVKNVDFADSAHTGDETATAVLQAMLQALPQKFQARPDLSFFVPVRLAQQYADEVSRRGTSLGDDVLVNGMPRLRYFGRPVVPDPHFKNESAAKAVLTANQNLVHGVQRIITIDSEWKPRKRVVEFTITARTDYEFASGEAIVLADNLPASLSGL